jgi:hypothetical protein
VTAKPVSGGCPAEMNSEKIEDPVETSFSAWPVEPSNLGDRMASVALSLVGIKFVPAKIVQILRDQFAPGARFQRIEYLFDGLRLGFKQVEAEMGGVSHRVEVVNKKLEGEQFREAVAVACEESTRAVNYKKIEQMAAVLVGYIKPTGSNWADPEDDVASLIRDLAQLSDRDVQALQILAKVHSTAISQMPDLGDPHQFSKETKNLLKASSESGFHRDDFLSTCERLRGFGLGAEVLRNTSHMGPEEFCYRPTRRGLVLLDYLKGAAQIGGR